MQHVHPTLTRLDRFPRVVDIGPLLALALAAALAACATPEKDAAAKAEASVRAAAERARESVEKPETTDTGSSAAPETTPPIHFGNGDLNWIVTDGLRRDGATLTFVEVQIEGNGWLVLHPFEDGRPVGARYSAARFLESGMNNDVEISLDTAPASGTMFLVMLHRDVNENRQFDFVFVDERNVLDRAVFEGTTMIAHPIAVP